MFFAKFRGVVPSILPLLLKYSTISISCTVVKTGVRGFSFPQTFSRIFFLFHIFASVVYSSFPQHRYRKGKIFRINMDLSSYKQKKFFKPLSKQILKSEISKL